MWLLIFLLLTGQAFADSKQSSFTTSIPVSTDFIPGLKYTAPSTYSNVKYQIQDLITLFGTGGGGSGNIGIGTPNYMTQYVGVSTLGPSSMVSVAGNFGIGSTAPNAALDVLGTVKATAFTGDGSGLTGISSSGWTHSGTNLYTSTSTDNVGIGTLSPIALLNISSTAAQDLFRVDDNGLGDDTPGIWVNQNGNVGIGTSQVGAVSKLTVVDQSNNPGNIRMRVPSNTANAAAWIVVDSADALGVLAAFPSAYTAVPARAGWIEVIAQTGSQGVGLDTDSSKPIKFAISGNEVARFVVGGNLGLGTISPVSKLSIQGNLGIGTTTGDNFMLTSAPLGGAIFYGNVGVGTYAPSSKLSVIGVGTTSATSALTIRDSNNTPKTRFLDNGNVGLNSTIPQSLLDVQGTITGNGFQSNGNVGISTTAPTTCGCKQYTNGLCTTVGTCS